MLPAVLLEPSKESVVANYESAIIELLSTMPFFAKLIMTMKKDFNFPITTAGVSVKSTGITLHINKEFFNSLSHKERIAILLHESLHVIHGHTNRFRSKDQGTANVACDVAINQYIQNLPTEIKLKLINGEEVKGKIATYERLAEEIKGLQPKMSSEYYFNLIKQEQQKNGDDGDGEGDYQIIDDHSQWKDTDLTAEQSEKLVKGHVKAVLDSCSDKEREVLDKTIIDEFYKSDINWKQQLRSFFCNSEETFTELTRKKRNRRYGIMYPGTKNECKLKLGIAVDTSGSISDDQLKMFFGEIDRIYNESTMELYVMEADMKIQNCYKYKKNMKIEASGRGGTAYAPAFEKAKELKVDGMIYMGDMDCSDTPTKPNFPVLWSICGKQQPPVQWGRKIYIE